MEDDIQIVAYTCPVHITPQLSRYCSAYHVWAVAEDDSMAFYGFGADSGPNPWAGLKRQARFNESILCKGALVGVGWIKCVR
jgi:hypothetical protein